MLFDQESEIESALTRFEHDLHLTKAEESEYNASSQCWLCNEEIEDGEKVRDHCHATGKFRGAAHKMCNIRICALRGIKVSCFAHNASNYDSHLLLSALASPTITEIIKDKKKDVMTVNSQKVKTLDMDGAQLSFCGGIFKTG